MKKLFSIILVFAILLTIAGCGTGGETTPPSTSTDVSTPESAENGEETPATTDKPRIALVIPTQTTDFFVVLKDAAVKYAEEIGVELIVLDSQDDAAKQASNMEDVIIKEVDVILFTPTDSDAAVNSVIAANEANIPVITIDRSSSGGEIVSHIASDNIAGGKMAGEFIIEQLNGAGKVVELEGIAGTSAARDRGTGFNQAIELAPEMEIVAKQTAEFAKAEGMSVMENILQAQETIDAVFAHNDEMALGAMEAISASGRTGILIVGFDASADAVAAVKAGTMAATVAQQPGLMVQTGIDAALKLLAGETVEENIPVALELITK